MASKEVACKQGVMTDYQNGVLLEEIADKNDVNLSTIHRWLKKWNVERRPLDPAAEIRFRQAAKVYWADTDNKNFYDVWVSKYGVKEANKRHSEWKKKRDDTVARKRAAGEIKTSSWRKGITTYQLWLAKHGKDEADRRNVKMKKKMSRSSRGAGNAMFGKPSPSQSSRGGTGWFRGCFFRSLRELAYMMQMDDAGSQWISAEDISIPYVVAKTRRTYHPDFLVDGVKLIEIKPVRDMSYSMTKAKARAARRYCLNRGWTYHMVDPVLDIDRIYREFIKGNVKFTVKYEDLFMDRYVMDGKLITY